MVREGKRKIKLFSLNYFLIFFFIKKKFSISCSNTKGGEDRMDSLRLVILLGDGYIVRAYMHYQQQTFTSHLSASDLKKRDGDT